MKCFKRNINFKCTSLGSYHHMVSKIFPPASLEILKDKTENTQKIINFAGIFTSTAPGLFCILPLGLRSLGKLEKLIDFYMGEIGAQKISLPFLTPSGLWKKSERYESSGVEVGKFKDRHDHEYILSPTHEEAITDLIGKIKLLPSAQMPLRLYQVSTKFRDEKRLKLGLIRGREFLMKDLYTFDKNIKNAHYGYKEILNVYDKLFSSLDLATIKVEAAVGSIGGSLSHEYHIPIQSGEDNLFKCNNCNVAMNSELISYENIDKCQNCGGTIEKIRGLEVAHAFFLGTKYSKPFSALFRNSEGQNEPLQMGCYGIGLSRLLYSSLQYLSSSSLKWPEQIAPFRVCLIPPKAGSKEDVSTNWCTFLESTINELSGYKDEVIVDDRIKLTIGKRLDYAKKFGFPIIIIIGKDSIANVPLFELNDCKNNVIEKFTHLQIVNYLTDRNN